LIDKPKTIREHIIALDAKVDTVMATTGNLVKEVEGLSKLIVGNGNPVSGVLFRLATLEGNWKWGRWLLVVTATAVIGVFIGHVLRS
jgi:hypothetical protein